MDVRFSSQRRNDDGEIAAMKKTGVAHTPQDDGLSNFQAERALFFDHVALAQSE